MTILLIFDVETSGLLPRDYKMGTLFGNLSRFPYILQLSYLLYDLERAVVIETYNQYITKPTDLTVSKEITDLTGISEDILKEKGIPIEKALESFKNAYLRASCLIAHNLNFDSTMISIEIERNQSYMTPQNYNVMINIFNKNNFYDYGILFECTMQMTVNFCNLERTNSRGVYKKLPKLLELYQILFDTTLDNLHNSMVDVFACLRCYLKYKYQYTIEESEFHTMIEKALSVDI
jgi:DNA polymerase III epsilon subunit-like protein